MSNIDRSLTIDILQKLFVQWASEAFYRIPLDRILSGHNTDEKIEIVEYFFDELKLRYIEDLLHLTLGEIQQYDSLYKSTRKNILEAIEERKAELPSLLAALKRREKYESSQPPVINVALDEKAVAIQSHEVSNQLEVNLPVKLVKVYQKLIKTNILRKIDVEQGQFIEFLKGSGKVIDWYGKLSEYALMITVFIDNTIITDSFIKDNSINLHDGGLITSPTRRAIKDSINKLTNKKNQAYRMKDILEQSGFTV